MATSAELRVRDPLRSGPGRAWFRMIAFAGFGLLILGISRKSAPAKPCHPDWSGSDRRDLGLAGSS
jgi:hypothetical protein